MNTEERVSIDEVSERDSKCLRGGRREWGSLRVSRTECDQVGVGPSVTRCECD